jgi:hypothetical protein
MVFTLDDTEEATYEVSPDENVWSFLMFIGPAERALARNKPEKERNLLTCDYMLGYLLVCLTLFMQGLLLYAVFIRVVGNQVKWEGGILHSNDHGMSVVGGKVPGCNPGKSLCTFANDTFSCAPPTVRFSGLWDELDTNGDGIWTRDEVIAKKDELQCKYVANPIEVFDVFIDFLKNREKIIWLHPAVRAGDSIPKPYFTYASGDIIMCGYRDDKMCPNLMDRGFFDAPLEFDTVPRVGNSIDSALDYCYQLLKEGGMCERALPSTYSVWKVKSNNECGKKSYKKIVYEHPKSGDFKSMVRVDYSARKNVAKQDTQLFKVYKTIIISLWVMYMVYELRRLIIYFAWTAKFPSIEEAGTELEFDDDEGVTIVGVSTSSRMIILFVTIMRFIMLCALAMVGTSLLLQSPEYMSLIFDAVSLAFVIEIAEIMFGQLLRAKVRDQTTEMKMKPFDKPGLAYFNERGGLVDVLWLCTVVVVAIAIMLWHYKMSVEPMGQALMCTCLSTGEHCEEANKFSYDFWHQYWKVETPQIFKDVDVLKKAWKEEQERSSLVQVNSAAFGATAHAGKIAVAVAAHHAAAAATQVSAKVVNASVAATATGNLTFRHARRAGRAATELLHRALA